MARPVKYATQEERDQARREQTRKHVQKYRSKKRETRASTVTTITVPSPASQPDQLSSEYAPSSATSEMAIVTVPDFARHTERAEIELMPDVLLNMAHSMQARHTSYPYLTVAEELGKLDEAIRIGVFMLGTTFFGNLKRDSKMIAWSQDAYKQLLPRMRDVIEHQRPAGDIVAVVPGVLNNLLMSAELIDCAITMSPSQRCAWILHHRASPEVFEASGPYAFRSPLGLKLLRIMRPRIVFMAIYYGSSVFLDSDEWRTVPFLNCGRTNDDNLWHLVEMIPGCFQRSRELDREDITDAERCGEILAIWKRLEDLRDALEIWMHTFEQAHTSLRSLPSPAPFTADIQGEPPHFPSRDIAQQLNTYLYHIFLLFTFMTDFHKKHALFIDVNFTTPKPLPTEAIVLDIAARMCQTMHFLISDSRSDVELTMYYISYPNRNLIEYFGRDPAKYGKELLWCNNLARHISNMDFLGRVSEFFLDCYYPPVHARE